jgi:hypothetical protein
VIAVGGDGTLHEVFVCGVLILYWYKIVDIEKCAGGEWFLLERNSSPRS